MLSIYNLLKSRTLTVLAICGLLLLLFFQASTQKGAFWLYIIIGLPLALNLLFCLIDHLRCRKLNSVKDVSFWLFHLAFLVIIVGGLSSYLTRTSDFITMVEGDPPFSLAQLNRANNFGWPKTQASVVLSDVTITLWPNLKLKDLKTELNIIEPNGHNIPAILATNSPLHYKGLIISMTRGYGLAPHFSVINPKKITSGYVVIPHREAESSFKIPHSNYTGFIEEVDFADKRFQVKIKKEGRIITEKEMGVGDIMAFGGIFFQIDSVSNWSQINIVNDPLRYIVYFGFFLFITMVLLYYRYQLKTN